MIERGKTYILFYIDTKNQIITKCNEVPEATNMPLPEFFKEYLAHDILDIKDAEYGFKFFVDFINSSDEKNVAEFTTTQEDTVIRFTKYFKVSEDLLCCAVFKQENSAKNIEDNYKKDYLTGLYSRGDFTVIVNAKLKDMHLDRSALMVIDLDNFKTVNDTFGHATGDACLRDIAGKINDACNVEIVGRYGGDEFLVFVEHADKNKIHEYCKRLMDIEYVLPTRFSRPIKVTCSVGVCYTDDHLNDINALFDLADKALYKAKNTEKNCSCIFDSGLFFIQPKADPKAKRRTETDGHIHFLADRNQLLFKEELSFRRGMNLFISTIIALTLILFLILLGDFLSNRVYEKNTTEAKNVMNDISLQMSKTLSFSLDNLSNQLRLATDTLVSLEDSTNLEADAKKTIEVLVEHTTFNEMAIILSDGTMIFADGSTYEISNIQLLDEISGNDKIKISKINIPNHHEDLTFAIPYKCGHLKDSNVHVVSILGFVNLTHFSHILTSNVFNSSANFAIIDSNGDAIIRSAEEVNGNKSPDNFFDLFEKYGTDDVLDKITTDIQNNYTDIVNIDIIGVSYFSFYQYMNINDWYILIMVPIDEVLPNILILFKELQVLTFSLLAVISLLTILCGTIFTIYHNKNLSLVYTDPITGNINGERFKVDAEKLIQRNKTSYAIVYVDIQHFKYLNEVLGNVVADKLLLELYEELLSYLSKQEIAARIFADRYVMLCQYDTVERLVDRLNTMSKEITKHFTEDSLSVKLAIGVYLLSGNKYDLSACIDRANEAGKFAKTDFDNNFISIFDETMLLKNLEKIEMETDAEKGLQEGQFEIYYQLKKNIKNDLWDGSEALVRWIHPKKGLIPPTKFVSIFENSGFIIKLDLFVFETVCKDIRRMIDSGISVQTTSFNLSRVHFIDENFLDEFKNIIMKYDIPPNLLEFEVTESMVFEDAIAIKSAIDKIHRLGSRCSIDDFGSGYSSLNILKEFDFDTIKFDRVFFYGISGFDKKSKIIIESLTDLSHKLRKKVVAEGIETEEQVKFLKSINCDIIQGFYYSKPLPFNEYVKKIK